MNDELVEFVREAADGWTDDLDPDSFTWEEKWTTPKIFGRVMTPSEWAAWYADEKRSYGGNFDELEAAWMREPEQFSPIILADLGGGRSDIGDGWHRAAIAVVRKMKRVPVVIGTLRSRPRRMKL